MQISFGNKIPVSKAQIYDKQAREFREATLYEIDGNDGFDVDNLACCPGEWHYKYLAVVDLMSKVQKQAALKNGDIVLSDLQKHLLENNRFYTLETANGNLAAMCEVRGASSIADVHFVESKKNNYGLAGQVILASIVKQMLKKPEPVLNISDPALRAEEFYMKRCGFKKEDPRSYELKMEKEDMEKFVSSVEAAIDNPIEDIE